MLTFAPLQVAVGQPQFSRMITFGDSLSDTGNIASLGFPLPFPFYQNRITDGPVPVDYLAAHLGASSAASLHLIGRRAGFNYAVAGGNIVGNQPEDLSPQVSAYLSRVGGRAERDALYVLIIGANDLRDIRSISSASTARSRTDAAVATLIAQMRRLTQAGATNLLVANVPNIGRLPESIERGLAGRAKSYTQGYNRELSDALRDFRRQTGAKVVHFDFYAVVEDILNRAASLGFTQTTVGCFDIDGFDFHPDCLFGSRFDRFVFFDNVHPSGKTNRFVGDALIRAVSDFSRTSAPVGALQLLLLD